MQWSWANVLHELFMKIAEPKNGANPNFSARNHPSPRGREHGKIWVSLVGITTALLFSFFLMFHTFSYDGQKQEMGIASKAWSDFGAHIPLIRSFSYGPNINRLLHGKPVESPLFPGEPIRYHFGFYALVGLLERLGMRIDWALNIPSAIGFFLLLVLIFQLSYSLFTNYWVSFLTVIFFLFNGSLSFVQFFNTHTIRDIVTNSRFPSFGPWDGGTITAFWNLNIYTNQRHLALSYALIVLLILGVFRVQRNQGALVSRTALVVSVLLFINYAAAGVAGLFLLWFLLIKKEVRLPLVLAALLSLPAMWALTKFANVTSIVSWQPGYLTREPLTLFSFARFWWENLGANTILIPLGVLLAPAKVRRLLAPPLLLLFILPNLFRFSQDMINNHKLFNFFLILGNMFSAYAVVRIGRIRHIGLISLIGLIFFSTLSGIIDFFPILNDSKGSIPDRSEDIRFFQTQTHPTDIIANSTWLYHPASVAGRSIYSGYTYFTWSYGYDQGAREARLKAIYEAPDIARLCRLLSQARVSYIELNDKPESYLTPNENLWNARTPTYENPDSHLRIYTTQHICPNEKMNQMAL